MPMFFSPETGALSDICLQISFMQLLQYTLNMNFVLSFNLTIDQNVIEIHNTEDVKIFSQSVIDVILK